MLQLWSETQRGDGGKQVVQKWQSTVPRIVVLVINASLSIDVSVGSGPLVRKYINRVNSLRTKDGRRAFLPPTTIIMISIASPTNVCFLSFALLVSVSLWLFIAWKVWRRWMASVRLTASDAAPIYPDTLIQHVESQMPPPYKESRKHNGSSINQDNIEHAHASSSRNHRTHSSRSPHNTSQERETDGLLSPRALSQRSYSGVSSNHRPSQRQHHSRSQTRNINPSRVLTDHSASFFLSLHIPRVY